MRTSPPQRYQDDQNIHAILSAARNHDTELDIDPDTALYVLSRITLGRGDDHALRGFKQRTLCAPRHRRRVDLERLPAVGTLR
ncbi:MAG: hypothetical protein M3N95_16955 [Actinomycetota bacterium]|nr:hypothetical protein [Actinomycetota bacterium]